MSLGDKKNANDRKAKEGKKRRKDSAWEDNAITRAGG